MKLLCQWHQWIMYDLRKTSCLDVFSETQNMRIWLIEMLNALEITSAMLPDINEKNYLSVWFEVDRNIDKQSFVDMKHEFYEVKKNYYGYFAREIVK